MRASRPILLLALAAPALLAPPAPAAAPDAAKTVAEWVVRIRDGGSVYPGGRQRDLLERHPKTFLPALVESFANEDLRVGGTLWKVAALAPVETGQEILWAALDDDRPFVPEFAALTLGRMRSEAAIPMLMTAFRRGRLSLESATEALASIGRGDAEPALTALMSAYTATTRAGAAAALGSFPTPGARKALVRACKDRTPAVRVAALRALATAGGPDEIGAVIRSLRDEDDGVRLAAMNTLAALGNEKAREALTRHFNAESAQRLEALEAATAAGEPVGRAACEFATPLLAEDDVDRRRRAVRLLSRSDVPEAVAALRTSLSKEADAETAFAIAHRLVARGVEGIVPDLRGLLERFPDRVDRILDLLDIAGDPGLPERLRSAERIVDAPAGGPVARLVFDAGPEDVGLALGAARVRPKDPGLLADAYLLVMAVAGPETIDALARGAQRLPAVDLIVVTEGPVRPGIRHLHMYALRALSGRAFGYAPSRADADIRNAMRRALKWWITTGRKSPAGDPEAAARDAQSLLTSPVPDKREAALCVLARADRRDALHRFMIEDAAATVRIAAARHLVEARDPRGAAWLVEHFADEDLVDWAPFIESPRPTRLEAARALWRAANRCFEYRGEPLEREWCRDLVLEESRRWRRWWAEEGELGPDAWFAEGCRRRGIALGEGKDAQRTLADVLGGDHPRFFKLNALARLREMAGDAILRISVPDLEVMAPGESHPIFAALAWRWKARLETE